MEELFEDNYTNACERSVIVSAVGQVAWLYGSATGNESRILSRGQMLLFVSPLSEKGCNFLQKILPRAYQKSLPLFFSSYHGNTGKVKHKEDVA